MVCNTSCAVHLPCFVSCTWYIGSSLFVHCTSYKPLLTLYSKSAHGTIYWNTVIFAYSHSQQPVPGSSRLGYPFLVSSYFDGKKTKTSYCHRRRYCCKSRIQQWETFFPTKKAKAITLWFYCQMRTQVARWSENVCVWWNNVGRYW